MDNVQKYDSYIQFDHEEFRVSEMNWDQNVVEIFTASELISKQGKFPVSLWKVTRINMALLAYVNASLWRQPN
jgi:hypothetical protein